MAGAARRGLRRRAGIGGKDVNDSTLGDGFALLLSVKRSIANEGRAVLEIHGRGC